MLSFYHLPSTIVRHPVHKILKVAYAFYNVSFTVPLKDLLLDSLILAKKVCCWHWYNSSDSNLANIDCEVVTMVSWAGPGSEVR